MGKKIQCIGRYALEGHLLGKGSFAKVELAHHSVTGCKVAIKIIDTRKLKEEYQKNNLQREARIMGQLRHPNIVRLYETLKATTLHCLVMEYASGGELQAFIKLQKDFRLSEDRGRPYVRQLVSALHYLHERGVAHRDLKMENIMLDTPKKNVKLVDFGLSNTFAKDELMKTHCGSPEYAAPELFTPGEKYGMEIDIWSLGVVMYAIMVGKLPFTTPYTDQYRRQKLVQQMEKGLVEAHQQEMTHLTTDCQDLLHKVIEPSPSLRIPLLDMELHAWVTDSAKTPFFPFQSFPRDKNLKMQTLEELATALNLRKDIVEQKVAENKSDEMSAMFNMILDRKRQQQGMFDQDHTCKAEKRETKTRRSKSAHVRAEGKHNLKGGPPELVLPSDDVTAESAPHSGNDQEQETKFSSFDFLALCSTPTWLGPERRKSRRRSRSPMPSPHITQHGNQGLSVRSQMKRDYMERQAMEMEREMLREERASQAALLSPGTAGYGSQQMLQPTNSQQQEKQQQPQQQPQQQQQQQKEPEQQLNDPQGNGSTSLAVPGSEPTSTNQLTFRRNSSLKLSRRRAKSCGPTHKRKSSFQRSGSVDVASDKDNLHVDKNTLTSGVASTKEGSSAPVIASDVGPQSLLQTILPWKTLETPERTERTKTTTTFPENATKMVAKSDMDEIETLDSKVKIEGLKTLEKKNQLGLPQVRHEQKRFLIVPNSDIGNSDSLFVPTSEEAEARNGDSVTSVSEKMNSIPRPGKLILKECYRTKDEKQLVTNSTSLTVKPLLLGENGPLANVEVHHESDSNPMSSRNILSKQDSQASPLKPSRLQVPNPDAETRSDSVDSFHLDSTDTSLMSHASPKKSEEHSPKPLFPTISKYSPGLPPLPVPVSSSPSSSNPFTSPIDSTTVVKKHVPPNFSLPNHQLLSSNACMEERTVAMQQREQSKDSGISSENRILHEAQISLTCCEAGCKGNVAGSCSHSRMHDPSDDYLDDTDHADSMTELISDSFKNQDISKAESNTSNSSSKIHENNSSAFTISGRLGLGALPKSSHEIFSNFDEDYARYSKPPSRKGSGSLMSLSRSSKTSSGRRSTGKVKSPTTPNWMVLKTPLARIESFHSDDFDSLAESELLDASSPSASPMSATTPTVPCFAYKLHVMKKKQNKLKSSRNSSSKTNNDDSSKSHPKEELSSKQNRASDKKQYSGGGSDCRYDIGVTEPLLSSGSETEHHEECMDRLGAPGKSKIHPIVTDPSVPTDDKDLDLLKRPDSKCIPYSNAITKQPSQVKNSSKYPKIVPSLDQGGKKKMFVKNLAWKKSFSHFLKRKRYQHQQSSDPTSPQHIQQQQPLTQQLLTQQQHHQQPPTNNNNNDFNSVRQPTIQETRNGMLVFGPVSNSKSTTETSSGTEGVGRGEKENCNTSDVPNTTSINTKPITSVPVENNIAELIEQQSSPNSVYSPPPSGRVFDFTMTPDTPKVTSSCLLGWGSCRDCGRSNTSSEEDIDCFSTHGPTTVNLSMKTCGESNPTDSLNFTQTYQFSPT